MLWGSGGRVGVMSHACKFKCMLAVKKYYLLMKSLTLS